FGGHQQAASSIIHKRKLKTGEIVEEVYIPVYYPGVAEEQSAASITIEAGGAAGGIDFAINGGLVPRRHIRGQIVNAGTGQTDPGAQIIAVPKLQSSFTIVTEGRSNGGGGFDLAGIVPGSYFIFAEGVRMSAVVPVEVGNNDLENIVI